MSITLTDDGTLDTVLRCSQCGEEFRGTWDGESGTLDEFVAWLITEVTEEHTVCSSHPFFGPTETIRQ